MRERTRIRLRRPFLRFDVRPLVFGGLLVAGAIAYALLIVAHERDSAPAERAFGPAPGAAAVAVYADMISIDPVRQSLRVRFDFAPDHAPNQGLEHPAHTMARGAPGRDLEILVSDGDSEREIAWPALQPMPTQDLQMDLADGSVADFPLDRYHAVLGVAVRERGGAPLPLRLRVWPGITDWVLTAAEQPAGADGGVRLRIGLRRTGAIAFFAFALYTAMVVMGAAAVAIGGLIYLGHRRVEVALLGALGAMVFAVPALRRVVPGDPPLGVRGDMLVFLWAELAVVTGLTLVVWTWVRRRPPS